MTEKGERKDKGKLIFLSFPYSSVLQIAGHKPLVGYEINVVSHDLAFKNINEIKQKNAKVYPCSQGKYCFIRLLFWLSNICIHVVSH